MGVMGLFGRFAGAPERRSVRRVVVDCPARFRQPGGDRQGRLRDLSEQGARLELAAPPAAGGSGFLVWNGQEHFGKVVWSQGGACGIAFDRPIPAALVAETGTVTAIEDLPVARCGNIPLGQRRARSGG